MAILGGFLRRNRGGVAGAPILREMAAAAVEAAADRIRSTTGQTIPGPVLEQAVVQTAETISRNPVVANNTNQERKVESRVVVGTVTSTIQAVATFLTGFSAWLGVFGPTLSLNGPAKWVSVAVMVFGGGGTATSLFALIGRLRDDLPPMYNRWWNPLSWLARDREEVLAEPVAPLSDGNA